MVSPSTGSPPRSPPQTAGGEGDRPVDALLERRDAHGAAGDLDLAVDQDARRGHLGLRGVAVLEVDRPVADLEAEVGAGGARHVHLAAP